MITNIPTQTHVQSLKAGWTKQAYQVMAAGEVISLLKFSYAYGNRATAAIMDREFTMRRRGLWKYFLEITSTSHPPYNMKIDLHGRSRIKITDAGGNSYTFKSTSIWKSRWAWFDRMERPVIEIKSQYLSRKSRGLIHIIDPEMKDPFFWITVSWFIILCYESDAFIAAI